MSANTNEFNFPIRVYYEDTDAGGIVYYANYLKFFERARTEWLRELGIEQDILLKQNIGFVVTQVEMRNRSAAKFNEMLNVNCKIKQLKKASLVFSQSITNQSYTVAEAEVKVACVDIKQLTPMPIPNFVLEELSRVI